MAKPEFQLRFPKSAFLSIIFSNLSNHRCCPEAGVEQVMPDGEGIKLPHFPFSELLEVQLKAAELGFVPF